jgi:anthranilate synthase component 1
VALVTRSRLPLSPTLEEARELARDHNVIPVRHTFIDDCETPVSAFLKLRGRGPAFLLESAEQGQRFGRYSFLGFRPRAILLFEQGRMYVREGNEERELDGSDPFAAVAGYLSTYRVAPLQDLPPFAGGAVGMFGYDLVRTVERLPEPNPDDVGTPDMALMVSDALIVFDHLRHQVTIMVNAFVDRDNGLEQAYERAAGLIERARALLAEPVPRAEGVADRPHPGDRLYEREFRSNMTRAEFERTVERSRQYIREGDVFQVVPSQRWSGPCPVEPFSVYRGLRNVNPSPYMYFLEFEDFQVAGASPEPLVKVSGRRVESRPIAGTRPRAGTPEEDLRRAKELLEDEKERAEHVMLVDLARNDLGAVCEYGSVQVEELMAVETYSHVMHIVSSVTGRLRSQFDAMDALRACLPAGTLSGAPKIRAMEIIDELEPTKRGFYGGAVGYLSYSGDLDTCIHIRTVVVKDGVAQVQAGAGIVADSDPPYEFRETLAKAEAVFKAIELALEQADWP